MVKLKVFLCLKLFLIVTICNSYKVHAICKHQEQHAAIKTIGKYQMHITSLQDIGYIDRKTKKWTGKDNICSTDDFLNNEKIQDKSIKLYHTKIWLFYLRNYHKYQGKRIAGVTLTKSGMIAAAHLVGHMEVKRFIDSRGTIDPQDTNGVKCSEYLLGFQGYISW